MTSPSTSFTASRLNDTTFVINEDDSWHERPNIFAVLHPTLPVLILSDTGCDSPREDGLSVTHLRDFLETCPIEDNDNQPLNPTTSRREYIVLCTHCHYDHIGGIEQFSTSVASAHGRDFVENDLPEHSLCKYIGIPTPQYKISYWAQDFERLTYPLKPAQMDMQASQYLPASACDLGVTIINTPGHTPDELAWYDHAQRHLYVGDSFYEGGDHGMAIQFPPHGSWLDYMTSMNKLLEFVRRENAAVTEEDSEGWLEVPHRLKIGCGHATTSTDGETILKDVIQLFERIIRGKVPVVQSIELRGEIYDLWRERGADARFSVRAPRRLCEEARDKIMSLPLLSSSSSLSEQGISGLLRKLPFGLR